MAKVMAAAPQTLLAFRVPRPSPFWGSPQTGMPSSKAMFTIEGALQGYAGAGLALESLGEK